MSGMVQTGSAAVWLNAGVAANRSVSASRRGRVILPWCPRAPNKPLRSASAIGRIAPRRGQQGHVIVAFGLGDREADRYRVEEGQRRARARRGLRGEIATDLEL